MIPVVWILATLCLHAQAAEMTLRRNLATALNQAMANVPATVPINSIGLIRLANIYSGCDTLNNLDAADDEVQLVSAGSGMFTLQVLRKPASTMTIAPDSHEMVCDLNGWLWFAWGTHLYVDTIGAEGKDSARVGVACLGSTTQQYFMGSMGARPAYTDSVIWTQQLEWSGRDGAGKSYTVGGDNNVVDNSGAVVSSFLSNNLWSFPTRSPIAYIGTFYDDATPTLNDTAIVKLAQGIIDFHSPQWPSVAANGYPDGAPRRVLTRISINAHTQKYSSDCSDSYDFGGGPAPDPSGAGVTLSLEYKDLSGTDTIQHTIDPFCAHSIVLGTPDETNDSLWKFFGWENHVSWLWGRFDIDSLGYLVFRTMSNADCQTPDVFRIMRLRSPAVPAEYCSITLPTGGTFCVDDMTGEIVYRTVDCDNGTTYRIPCLEFCEKISGYRTVEGVLAASAVRLSDDWSAENASFLKPKVLDTWPWGNGTNNSYETGALGNWRPEATFAYRTSIKSGVGTGRIYNDAGVFLDDLGQTTNGFRVFDWQDTNANNSTKWLQLNTTTIYSPLGEPLEERNILGIYSAARFAHENTVPKLVAKNARYNTVGFQSFEDGDGNTSLYAHSGQSCFALASGAESVPLVTITADAQTSSAGLLVSVWVKRTYNTPGDGIPISVNIVSDSNFRRVAKTGDWSLYEAEFKDFGDLYPASTVHDIRLTNQLWGGGDTVWVDDIKVQPLDAEMNCYVYDPTTLRLLTQFDDRHFGVFYQYNAEGKLTQIQRETERGLKTVSETEYHTPLAMFRGGAAAPGANLEAEPPPSRLRGGGRGTSSGAGMGSGTGTGTGADFDILDLEIGTEGGAVKMFGSENPTLPSIDSLDAPGLNLPRTPDLPDVGLPKMPNLDSLNLPNLPDVEKVKIVREIQSLDGEIEQAAARAESEGTEEGREKALKEVETLREQRRRLIVERLGITEDEYRRLIDATTEPNGDEKQPSPDVAPQ